MSGAAFRHQAGRWTEADIIGSGRAPRDQGYRHDGEGGVLFIGAKGRFTLPIYRACKRLPVLHEKRAAAAADPLHLFVHHYDEWIASLERAIEDAEYFWAEEAGG